MIEFPGIGYWARNVVIDQICFIAEYPNSLEIDIAKIFTSTSRPRVPQSEWELSEQSVATKQFRGDAFVKLAQRKETAQEEDEATIDDIKFTELSPQDFENDDDLIADEKAIPAQN